MGKEKLPFMPLWCGDYLVETAHLSPEADRAYFHLLIHYWLKQGPLSHDDSQLARLAKCTTPGWRKVKDEVLGMFTCKGDFIMHAKMDLEIAYVHDLSNKRRNASAARWKRPPGGPG